MATYQQLIKYGLTKNLVSDAIEEAEFLGLALVERGGKIDLTNLPNRFSLTWIPIKGETSPLNTWKAMTREKYLKWRKQKLDSASLKRGQTTPRFEGTKPELKVVSKKLT